MTGRVKVGVAIAVGATVLFAAGSLLWFNRPFQTELGSYRTSLVDRTEAQYHNIRQAVLALDGVVIEPGESFSFNDNVGPRIPERGYREAPAFMERDLVTSVGGGVCQVSSSLYNAALLSGLTIVERHAHFRRVTSVPPGRDATVWYGAADLKFKNQFAYPVRLNLKVEKEGLGVLITGDFINRAQNIVMVQPLVVSRYGVQSYRTIRLVEDRGDFREEVVSVDFYRI
ncbi:Vancomycin B-type resistance protein VanW [compost metagenome]